MNTCIECSNESDAPLCDTCMTLLPEHEGQSADRQGTQVQRQSGGADSPTDGQTAEKRTQVRERKITATMEAVSKDTADHARRCSLEGGRPEGKFWRSPHKRPSPAEKQRRKRQAAEASGNAGGGATAGGGASSGGGAAAGGGATASGGHSPADAAGGGAAASSAASAALQPPPAAPGGSDRVARPRPATPVPPDFIDSTTPPVQGAAPEDEHRQTPAQNAETPVYGDGDASPLGTSYFDAVTRTPGPRRTIERTRNAKAHLNVMATRSGADRNTPNGQQVSGEEQEQAAGTQDVPAQPAAVTAATGEDGETAAATGSGGATGAAGVVAAAARSAADALQNAAAAAFGGGGQEQAQHGQTRETGRPQLLRTDSQAVGPGEQGQVRGDAPGRRQRRRTSGASPRSPRGGQT
eukprot:SAG22_NODE_4092_length_1389_cov_1.431008_2_plen_409_part_01